LGRSNQTPTQSYFILKANTLRDTLGIIVTFYRIKMWPKIQKFQCNPHQINKLFHIEILSISYPYLKKISL